MGIVDPRLAFERQVRICWMKQFFEIRMESKINFDLVFRILQKAKEERYPKRKMKDAFMRAKFRFMDSSKNSLIQKR